MHCCVLFAPCICTWTARRDLEPQNSSLSAMEASRRERLVLACNARLVSPCTRLNAHMLWRHYVPSPQILYLPIWLLSGKLNVSICMLPYIPGCRGAAAMQMSLANLQWLVLLPLKSDWGSQASSEFISHCLGTLLQGMGSTTVTQMFSIYKLETM